MGLIGAAFGLGFVSGPANLVVSLPAIFTRSWRLTRLQPFVFSILFGLILN
jgi:hypothetical protein